MALQGVETGSIKPRLAANVAPSAGMDVEQLADAPKGSHLAAAPRAGSEQNGEGRGPQVIAQMEKAGYIDVYTRFGAPSAQTFVAALNPSVRIDYIFAGRALESSLAGCGIWMEPEGREASDHRPVYADLDIEGWRVP